MSLGYASYLLKHIHQVAAGNAPSTKVTPPGFLKMLLDQPRPDILSQGTDDGHGHVRDVRVKYRTRAKTGVSQDTDNCDVDVRPVYSEFLVTRSLFKKVGIFLDDAKISQYENDASNTVNIGQPATPFMNEQLDALMEQMNGFLGDINLELLTKQAANFGINVVTGLNTATTLNLPLSTTTNPLNSGIAKLLADIQANEIRLEDVKLVGNGLMNNFYMQQYVKGLDAAGINSSLWQLPKWYYDPYSATSWGANEFGVFEKNSVHFIDLLRNKGAFAGVKGSSIFFTLPLPITDNNGDLLSSFVVDVQMKYLDCAQDYVVAGYEDMQALGRGWIIIVSKSFDLVGLPDDAYVAGDLLDGVNGTLRYVATNT